MHGRQITIGNDFAESKLQRLIGAPFRVAARRLQRALGLDELATVVNGRVHELHKRVERRTERLLGRPLPKRRRLAPIVAVWESTCEEK